jgi:hypothetical protein
MATPSSETQAASAAHQENLATLAAAWAAFAATKSACLNSGHALASAVKADARRLPEPMRQTIESRLAFLVALESFPVDGESNRASLVSLLIEYFSKAA